MHMPMSDQMVEQVYDTVNRQQDERQSSNRLFMAGAIRISETPTQRPGKAIRLARYVP
jgi:hypothetical protein